jgi:hypothetical protein
MDKEQELENYLSISPYKFGIYLFDTKNSKNLYEEELIIKENDISFNPNTLKKFLDNNIFKIEKLSGKFLEDIIVIFEDKKILDIEIGIKKKNYNISVTKDHLVNLLIETKDLFRESYQNHNIIHMIINKYYINDKIYKKFEENLKCDQFGLQIQFKSIPSSVVFDLNKVLENFQIKIMKIIDGNYVKNFFDSDLNPIEMSHKIARGYNQNEVKFVPKNIKKLGFFEKFFQLFS